VPWFALDDKFHSHPKVISAGNEAIGLFARCGAYAAEHLTDGYIPEHVALLYGTPELAAALVRTKLWRRTKGGWRMPDYLDYNPSKAEVIHKREVRAEAGRKGGVESGKVRSASANTRSNSLAFASGLVEAKPNPHPHPGPHGVEVHVVSLSNGSKPETDTAVIDAIIKEIHDQTGKTIDPDWATRIAAELVTPGVQNPAAYVRQCIRNEPSPGLRFLPQYGRHAAPRKDPDD
jgi:hypothetical protein